MRSELAALVNPVIRTVLRLREEWAAGQGPPFDAGREQLRDAFRAVHQAHPPGRGGTLSPSPRDLLDGDAEVEPAGDLGLAYPLACWADELFTAGGPVAAQWTDRKCEVEYHDTNDRAWRFWQQADLAASLPTSDRLEVFYQCVALGFRGDKLDDSASIRQWLAVTRDRLRPGWTLEWVAPPSLDPPAHVPLRHGRARLRRMAQLLALTLLVCVPIATWSALRLLTW